MATSSPNVDVNLINNPRTSRSAYADRLSCMNDPSGTIFIYDHERLLYHKWLMTPHPNIDIVILVSNYRFLPASTLELEAEVRATITTGQTWRFELCAQRINISMVLATLGTFRQQMVGLKEDLLDYMQETLDITREEAEERLEKNMLCRGQLKPGQGI